MLITKLVTSEEEFAGIIELSKAHAELPPEAFGPPWYRRLWHEIVLR